MQIGELKIGQTAKITAFADGDNIYRQRLMSMGLLPGTSFTVSRIAPFGDPIEIFVRGYALCLRKQEAGILCIEAVA